MECVEAQRAMLGKDAFIDHCRASILAYAWRMRDKGNTLGDAKKIRVYAEWIVKELENGS